MNVDREQVLAYRVAAHGLDRARADLADLAVLDIGVQDTPPGSARLALAARLPDPPPADPTVDTALSLVWSHRGAPHLHRTADLPAVAAANWPRSDTDAAARLGWQRARLAAVGMAARVAYTEVTDAVRAVLTAPMTKGALSAAVTAEISPALSPWCRPCNTHHVSEQLLRLSGLPGGARLEFGSSPLTFTTIPGWGHAPVEPAGTDELISTYLRLFGPATVVEVAGFLGTNRTETTASWPQELAEVSVDGRPAWLPAGEVDTLHRAPPPRLVRLLPPSDPYLQARDRELIVPDKAHRKVLWTALGSPGAVLVDGEVAGIWRAKQASSGRLDVTVREFRSLAARERAEVEAEAERVGAVRGAKSVTVRVDG